jgi:hypothetical protein
MNLNSASMKDTLLQIHLTDWMQWFDTTNKHTIELKRIVSVVM